MSKNMKHASLSTRRKLVLNDGSQVDLTLNNALLYQLRSERKIEYDKFNDFIFNGGKDYFQLVDVLYVAYLCGQLDGRGSLDGAMSNVDFMLALPEDPNAIAEEVQWLTAPKKMRDSVAPSRSGQAE